MARRLAERHFAVEGVRLMAPVESNGVFVELGTRCAGPAARQGLALLSVGTDGCRLMCAWDTMPETVDRFVADLRRDACAGVGYAGSD